MVRDELDKRIKERVDVEFQDLVRSMRPERVVSQTRIGYYLPDTPQEPREFFLVKNRGFRQVIFCNRLSDVQRSDADVIILDVQNWKTNSGTRIVQLDNRGQLVDESEKQVREQIESLLNIPSLKNIVLIVYVRGNVNHLRNSKFEWVTT
ncbi:hypothetical protein Lepto7375DRAFT_0440 [Leptolyngbya sp. PCC 7375]|nr:hypothetical protein Lepto7375DRAFT_0440 [Leptolyngbya sp. PCC 7375]